MISCVYELGIQETNLNYRRRSGVTGIEMMGVDENACGECVQNGKRTGIKPDAGDPHYSR